MRRLVVLLFSSLCFAALSLVNSADPGALGLNLLADPPNAEIDIVAVHGLDGHWRRSWTAENGVFWLQDLLPECLPKTRIYSYSHGSRTRGSDVPLTLEISDHGRSLVDDLTDEREATGTEQRPVIFLGHSLGGLILKSALLHSDMARVGHRERQKSIKLSTYGVMFLGTPHQGAQGIELAKIITTVLSVFSHTDLKPLEQMASDSKWLMDLQERYNAISQDFETIFYYETLRMPVPLRGSILVVPECSAVVFGAVNTNNIPLEADHSTMVKFTSLHDENFVKIARKLDLYSNKASIAVKKNWENWSHSKPNATPYEVNNNVTQVPMEFKLGLAFKNVWNAHFTGRNQTLHLIGDILHPGEHAYELQVLVIYGTGGVGKTQLALEYAHRHQKAYASTFWIDARRPDTVTASMQQCVEHIMKQYEIHGMEESPRYQFLKKEDGAGRASEAFLTWLAYKDNRPWLLIIDNLDDIESVSLRDIIPSSSHGSVLVTSRRSDLAITWNAIHVPPMEHSEAFALLRLSSQTDAECGTEDWRSAQALIRQLAYLPLAISQAGAYIGMHRSETPFKKYLDSYHRHPKRLLGLKFRHPEWDAKDDTVLTTWEISFEAVQAEMQEAADILLISGCLAPEGIPQKLFSYGGFFSDHQVGQAFGILRSFSFVQQSIGASDVTLHPLVHLWARLRLSSDEQDATMQTALVMIREFDLDTSTPVGSHVSHAYSIYKERFPCTSPADYINLSVSLYDATENIFNLWPHGRTFGAAMSYATTIGHFIHAFFHKPLESEDLKLFRRDAPLWNHLSRALFDTDIVGWKKSEDVPAWLFCRAASHIPSQDPDVVGALFGYAERIAFEEPRRDDEEDPGEIDPSWYTWLLIWYGQATIDRHPVIAGLQVGFGLVLQSCHAEMYGLLAAYGFTRENIDTDSFNARHDNINMCLMRQFRGSERDNDLLRAITSWTLAIAIFNYQGPISLYEEWIFLPWIEYTRNATDPFSRAVLNGYIGDAVETTAPYMLLHLLDWKGSACLRYWPSSLAYLARHSFILRGNTVGGESAQQIGDIWFFEQGRRIRPPPCYTHEYYTKEGAIKCCIDDPDWTVEIYRRIQVECPSRTEHIHIDFTNESSCYTAQLALYLTMWYAAMGNTTGAHFWMSNIHTRPIRAPESRRIQWNEKCTFHQYKPQPPQSRLSFLEDPGDFSCLANYNADGVFDYIANAAVDILRGFHHNAIQKGRFSEQGAQEWLGISKSMAQLLLGPGMQKAASQDADFADFLVRSGNPPEGNPQETKRALRAWDTYGRRCPGRILRQTIVDCIGWFTPRGALPWSCWVDNPLSMMCPAVQSVTRRQEEATESRDREHIAARFWKFWGWKSG